MTTTTQLQEETEKLVLAYMNEDSQNLLRPQHLSYLNHFNESSLPSGFARMVTNIPWMAYWLVNGSSLLGLSVDDSCLWRVMSCFNYSSKGVGGWSGGPNQLPHLASSYAALCTLVVNYDESLLEVIDRQAITRWIQTLAVDLQGGSIACVMHQGGEYDTRSVYCFIVICHILSIPIEEYRQGFNKYLLSCQTYEGGFAGQPGGEAHGGYTYCALQALIVLNGIEKLATQTPDFNLDQCISWCSQRQFELEGGFSGRINKLVDSCYSHWVGNCLTILETMVNYKLGTNVETFVELFNRKKLLGYILSCCQDPDGGLRDKPDCNVDFYHTCYALSGLSGCFHIYLLTQKEDDNGYDGNKITSLFIEDEGVIDQNPINFVNCIDPVFGVPKGTVEKVRNFFNKKAT